MVRSYSRRASLHRVRRLKTYLPSCSAGACSSPNCWTTEANKSSFSFGSLRIFTAASLWVRESAHGKYRINGPGIEGGEVFLTAFAGLIANAGDIVDVGIEAIRQRLKLHRNEAATPVLSAQEWSANSILGLR